MRARSAPGIWPEIEAALHDPEMIDDGDPQPSGEAVAVLKRLVEQTERALPNPAPSPHVELFEGSIRLIWSNPIRNVRPSHCFTSRPAQFSVSRKSAKRLWDQ
jgi:hypothetical protein